ncbi:MAG TPA: FlgD immunoglobulin-like domain containing protein [Candidatus Eisenbacteria bacterium]|nr:FlgD immunoglobulin-like domain containing protein [Candidatus Eisenbacteria bacterium]
MKLRLPHRSPTLLGSIAGRARSMAFGFVAPLGAAFLLTAGGARAELLGGGTRPADPTVCDSVTLGVTGTTPSSCYQVAGMRVSEPELLPAMGPIPTYRIVARVRVEELDPSLGLPCTQTLEPYRVSAPLGRLPFGNYLVEANERVYSYPPDSMNVIDSSRVTFSFQVAPDSCRTGAECVLLGFAGQATIAPRLDGCTVRTAPGALACFDVTLANPVAVGGLQTEVTIGEPQQSIAFRDYFNPVAVRGTARTTGFDVAWSAGDSTAKIVLYAPGDAVIAPGRGPVLHICYEVNPFTSRLRYPIRFGPTIVAGPRGQEIPLCPTFAEVVGAVCVGGMVCDVNGDGTGDIRDIIRIVRCTLAGASDTSGVCPDSIRVRADCNEDGSVDVRDVICCVRRVLATRDAWGGGGDPGGEPGGERVRIGFDGAAGWTGPVFGLASLSVEATASFGGAQWVLDPGTAARIRQLSLNDPQGAYAIESHENPDGSVRVMLYKRAYFDSAPGAASPAGGVAGLHVEIVLEATSAATAGGTLRLRDWKGATAEGGALAVEPMATTAVVPANELAGAPAILPARPNPFVAGTEITYSLPAAGDVSLRIFDVSGRVVRTLASGPRGAGVHGVSWDGKDARGRGVGNGIYFLRLDAAGVTKTQRLMRLR